MNEGTYRVPRRLRDQCVTSAMVCCCMTKLWRSSVDHLPPGCRRAEGAIHTSAAAGGPSRSWSRCHVGQSPQRVDGIEGHLTGAGWLQAAQACQEPRSVAGQCGARGAWQCWADRLEDWGKGEQDRESGFLWRAHVRPAVGSSVVCRRTPRQDRAWDDAAEGAQAAQQRRR